MGSLVTNIAQDDFFEALAKQNLANGNYFNAIVSLLKGLEKEPKTRYRTMLSHMLNNREVQVFKPEFKAAVLACLKDNDVDHKLLRTWWHSLLRCDPQYKILNKIASYEDFITYKEEFFQAIDECFLLGLSNILVNDYGECKSIVFLRRYLLEHASSANKSVLLALSYQCFLNEYIFEERREEGDRVDSIADSINSGTLPEEELEQQLLIYSCYRPIHRLPEIMHISKRLLKRDTRYKDFFQIQVYDLKEEERIKKKIKTVGSLSNTVTKVVREQYEENPYPRWKNPGFIQHQEKGVKNILIAGCGTGLQVAARKYYKDVHITAIDISKASLAYAIRKCRELNIRHVDFYQADILEVELLGKQFDYILSTGVLHHMQDPVAGWQALTNVLQPGGFMKIALYSELARQHIVAIRDFIEQQGFKSDPDGIRACRAAISDLPENDNKKLILGSPDFYSLSVCRDLIFHAQEHRFSIPQIEEILKTLGLVFTGFGFDMQEPAQLYRQMFPGDASLRNLKNWDMYEQKYPRTFAGMYQFFCHKPV